jgi:DNA-binding PadR family transcriptional regulator
MHQELEGKHMETQELKRIDYEILSQIKDYRDRGMKIINYDFRSSTKNIRIAKLKREGYIKKSGRAKGSGTLALTEIGEQALRRLSEMYASKRKDNPSKISDFSENRGHYRIICETISGQPLNISSFEHKGDPKDILNALSKIGKGEVKPEGGT